MNSSFVKHFSNYVQGTGKQTNKKGCAIIPGSSNPEKHFNPRSKGDNSYKKSEKLDRRKLIGHIRP